MLKVVWELGLDHSRISYSLPTHKRPNKPARSEIWHSKVALREVPLASPCICTASFSPSETSFQNLLCEGELVFLAEAGVLLHYMTWVGLGSGVAEGIYSQHRASWLFPSREGGSQHGRLVVAHSKFVIPRNDLTIWSCFLWSVNTTATLRWRINSTL